jgi:hypothetical protein
MLRVDTEWRFDNLQGLSPNALKFWTNIIPLQVEKPMTKFITRDFLVVILPPGI